MRGIWLACLLGGSLGVAACLLELDDAIACGDGFVDRDAGEQCDPGVPGDFPSLCGGNGGSCHPETCQQQCCGDREVNGNEPCDGSLFAPIEPSLVPVGADVEEIGVDSCRWYTPLNTNVHFTSGQVSCRSDCTLDRDNCGFCGNGKVDLDEICDGGLVRLDELSKLCAPNCGVPESTRLGCNFTCENCGTLLLQEPNDCCLLEGAPREGTTLSCCCELDPRGCDSSLTGQPRPATCPAIDRSDPATGDD